MKSCKIDGCEKPSRNLGWCQMHYKRFRRHGDPLKGARSVDRGCSVPGCDKPHHAKGFCDLHWYHNRRNGSPDAGVRNYSNPDDAISARTAREGECIIWTGGQVKGYGVLSSKQKSVYVHRYVWERSNGPIPDGAVVDHLCYNTLCVRVDHLRLATTAENGRNRSGPSSISRSGVRGVYPRGKKWIAQVGMLGKSFYLGTFESIEAAEDAVRLKRSELFGEYAGR